MSIKHSKYLPSYIYINDRRFSIIFIPMTDNNSKIFKVIKSF